MTDYTTGGAARYAGARVSRVEDASLLTGRGVFVDDISLPGMLHACFVRSPFARPVSARIDTSGRVHSPGVHAVFTAADLNADVKEQWHSSLGRGEPGDAPAPARRGRGPVRG